MRIRTATLPTILLGCLALAGCGGESTSSEAQAGNNPPIITGTPPTQLMAGAAYNFTPVAQDPDGDTIIFSAENLPSWLQIDAATGHIWGTPTEANVGMSPEITIDAFDSKAHSELAPFRINVLSAAPPPPVEENQPPTISGTPGTTATVGRTYTFAPTAEDPDNDTLTFSITNSPEWATFSTSTGRLTGAPPTGATNVTGIVISVTDGSFTASLPAFNLTVVTEAPANRAPTISGSPRTSITAGTFYSFRPTASDLDGDTLTFSIQNKPTWAYSGSVLIEGDMAVASGGKGDGAVVAFDKATGRPLWKTGDDPVGYATPYPFTFEGKRYIAGFTGKPPRSWESPGLTETEETLDLLRLNGIDYVADWVIDDLPQDIATPHGTITTIPYSVETNDIVIHALQHLPSDQFLKRCTDQFDRLYLEGADNARVMAISVHPYITGVPHRIKYLEALLDYVIGHDGVALMTASEIGDWYRAEMAKK